MSEKTQHTPEPWEAQKAPAFTGQAVPDWHVYSDGAEPGHKMPACCEGPDADANAARIVACVNALAGMEPEAVGEVVGALEEIAASVGTHGPKSAAEILAENVKTAKAALRRLKGSPDA